MTLIEKLRQLDSNLIGLISHLQKMQFDSYGFEKQIQELVNIAINYRHIVLTIQEIQLRNNVAAYKNDLKTQLLIIEEFIDLTKDMLEE